jgi:hypothetical protein
MSTVLLTDGHGTPTCKATFIDLLTGDVDALAGALASGHVRWWRLALLLTIPRNAYVSHGQVLSRFG